MTYTLKAEDVAVVKGMLARGDLQSDIAAWFGVNGGRVAEINTRQKWAEVAQAHVEGLPPPGPYNLAMRSAFEARGTLEFLRQQIDDTLRKLKGWESP